MQNILQFSNKLQLEEQEVQPYKSLAEYLGMDTKFILQLHYLSKFF